MLFEHNSVNFHKKQQQLIREIQFHRFFFKKKYVLMRKLFNESIKIH